MQDCQEPLFPNIDSRYKVENVKTDIIQKCFEKKDGLLIPEKMGINQPLFRSRISEFILQVQGVLNIEKILWNLEPADNEDPLLMAVPFTTAEKSDPGKYFDLAEKFVVKASELPTGNTKDGC